MITAADRLIDQYSYAGAHTMLWNSMGVQIANLYSGKFKKPYQAAEALQAIASGSLEHVEYYYGPHGPWVVTGGKPMDALEVVASCLRSLFRAAPGHRFISADFTSIQAVVTSCLAREWWRINVFQTHGKIYEAMASIMTSKPLQFYLDYKTTNKVHHPDRQDWGKLPTLSGDFGAWIAGWKRFGAQKVLGSDDNIKAAILKNRAAQPNIVEFWGGQTRNKFNKAPDGSYAAEYQEFYGLEGAAIKAVLDPGTCYAYNGVKYQVYDDVLYCAGPSGGIMAYHTPRLKRSTRDFARPWELELTYWGWNTNANKGRQNTWEEMKLYGGVLTQNVVARESREFQAHVLLALDEPGDYPIAMHTHDEQVAEVPYGQGSVAGYMERARGAVNALDWAVLPNGDRWPIKIPDAWECEFYGKWED
jgi:DNA polymerase